MVGSLSDAITCAKFQVEIFRGYDFTGGVEFPIFLLISEWALQQCRASALPVIGRSAFLSALPFGGLGATYDNHLRLIGKRVADFLLVLIELFR